MYFVTVSYFIKMKLQTQIPLSKADNQFDYQSKLLLLGSCFVENIGDKLKYFKFQSVQNPFGILFHSTAIENLVQRAIENCYYTEQDVFNKNGQWMCFDAHSSISVNSKDELLQNLNGALQTTKEQITKSTHIIITLGTAWVYRNLASNNIVANCHKVPQKEFDKELLSVGEITRSLESIIQLIAVANPKAQIVFTISPVRHLKDGFVENQQSKAHLITAVHQIIKKHNVSYFESYEIMMDELRDYRFYGKDMVHPNELAIDYIWEKFKTVWISENTFPTMDEVDVIQRGLLHRPFNPESEEHQKFIESLQEKIKSLKNRYSFIKF